MKKITFTLYFSIYFSQKKGICFTYMYGNRTWHTGKHSLMVAPIFKSDSYWCMNDWKFYHTGLYIGHNKKGIVNG